MQYLCPPVWLLSQSLIRPAIVWFWTSLIALGYFDAEAQERVIEATLHKLSKNKKENSKWASGKPKGGFVLHQEMVQLDGCNTEDRPFLWTTPFGFYLPGDNKSELYSPPERFLSFNNVLGRFTTIIYRAISQGDNVWN